jgi:hypothetical protein
MRPSLTHPLSDRRRRHPGAPWRRSRDVEIAPVTSVAPAPRTAKRVNHASTDRDHGLDPTVQRARAAGGPVDLASYNCQCGLIFSASVSTTVACPHCGTEQDW